MGHWAFVYAADANILGQIIYTIKKNTEAVLVASRQTDLQVNVKKTKYMIMWLAECRTKS